MISGPGILFADEPTGALNKSNSVEALELLSGINQLGQTILMVTHDVKAAVRGTRILYLEDGKILDEISLDVWEAEKEKEREEKVTAWLSALRW